jgi:hypothetical protein
MNRGLVANPFDIEPKENMEMIKYFSISKQNILLVPDL